MKSLFLTVEGIDASGKSTQIERLVVRLRSIQHPVIVVREPGGTTISESIRTILLDNRHSLMEARAELLLYTAARAQIVSEKILPALQAGHIVVCDRYIDSTVAYQGYGRQLDLAMVQMINKFATQNLLPDCTILLDIPIDLAAMRRRRKGGMADRLEQEARQFYERVRAGYLEIARREPHRVHCLDGAQPEDKVEAEIWQIVQQYLPDNHQVADQR